MITTTTKAAAALLMLSLLSGCGEKFLDVSPNSSVTNENFYKNETDAIQATNAAYAELSRGGQYNYALWGIGDIMSDNSTTGGGGGGDAIEHQQLDFFNIPASNPVTTRLWNGSYVGIGRANIVLDKVPGISNMSDKIRQRCLGEAHFLRAKYYFDLVRAFGDIPLIIKPPTSPDEARIPRTPAAQVYAQIISDLTAATGELEDGYTGTDIGRATKWAAMGLLAKVQLTQGNMAEAAKWSKQVIDSQKFSLWTDYGDNFKLANENGKESIFEVQYVNGKNEYTFDGLGFVGNEFFGPRGQGLVPQNGYGINIPEQEFVQGYEEGDKRRDVTIWKPGDKYPDGRTQPASLQGSPNGYNVKKWFVGKTNTNVWDSPLNVPVLRLAEMYLIHAEASGPGEGLASLNAVRRRAFGNNQHDVPAGLSADAFKAAVIKERRYELAFENDRWFDLKRTGDLTRLPALLAKGVKSFNALLPIPQSERDANPSLTQNPGY